MPDRSDDPRPNLATPTLGGMQLWADERVLAGWRIQRHGWTGHFRLLDDRDRRQAWGDYAACEAALERAAAELDLRYTRPHLAVLIHGMASFTGRLAPIARALAADGYGVASVSYPSTLASLGEHAEQLNRVMDRIVGPAQVSFVGHSMGGLVIRTALAQPALWRERMPVQRVVLIATPNQGSHLAERFKAAWGYARALGPAGQDVAVSGIGRVPPLDVPFGVIAAGRGDGAGYNPLLPGDDDGVVSVQATALPGAADACFIQGSHNAVLGKPETAAAVRSFLTSGRFEPSALTDVDPEPAP